jgi:SNF2 family DNA or RNA helicase
MIRRKKTEVTDLPRKNYIDEILEMDAKQESLYNTTSKLTEQKLKELKERYGTVNKGLLASSLVSLRKVTCNPCLFDEEQYPDNSVKFDRAKQLLEQIVENGEKAVIFCTWAEPLKILFDDLKEYNPAMIIGATKDRMFEVNKFQEDISCKVILGTVGAMGTGLTLTAGSNIIFLDEPWNRALKDQAVDRCNRIGATKVPNIYTLMCKDTIDLVVHRIITSKGKVQDFIVDGKTDEKLTPLQKAIQKVIEEGEQ